MLRPVFAFCGIRAAVNEEIKIEIPLVALTIFGLRGLHIKRFSSIFKVFCSETRVDAAKKQVSSHRCSVAQFPIHYFQGGKTK